ncbi:hypothetical protein, partial [Burkholderia pseudomallei]|uniref:hypothetical protein n=1 Tax=Burkholderia pseudomallei TaxID=28450 RepID=UPI0019D35F23
RPTSSSSGIVQLKQPRPFSKIEMARRNQAGQNRIGHLNRRVLIDRLIAQFRAEHTQQTA